MVAKKQYHLVIFGGQGSGKGTQARILEKKLGVVYIGLGDLLRELADENHPTAKKVRQTLAVGDLMPDEFMNQMVALKLGNIPPIVGFILDGYPRTVAQAAGLHQTLAGLTRLIPKPIFINLEAPKSELLKRLHKRRELENREDETDEAIARRLSIYEERTKPVLDSVGAWANILHVNGHQPIAKVTDEILEKLENHEART